MSDSAPKSVRCVVIRGSAYEIVHENNETYGYLSELGCTVLQQKHASTEFVNAVPTRDRSNPAAIDNPKNREVQ